MADDVPVHTEGHGTERFSRRSEERGCLWPIIGVLAVILITVGVCWYFMGGSTPAKIGSQASAGISTNVPSAKVVGSANPATTPAASAATVPASKVVPPDTEATFEAFEALVWYEGASKEYGHVLYSNKPLVGDDWADTWQFFAPVFAKHYDLKPILKTASGRKAWALVPLKKSYEVPREVMERYRPQKRAAPPSGNPKGGSRP